MKGFLKSFIIMFIYLFIFLSLLKFRVKKMKNTKDKKRKPIPPTLVCSSPVEHTLEVLQDRLSFAEEETLRLSKQLSQYGFQRYEKTYKDIKGEFLLM